MSIVIKKPILVAGVSLSFLLWLGQYLAHYLGEIGNVSIFLVLFVSGISLISRKIKPQKSKLSLPNFEIKKSDLEQKISQINNLIANVITEAKQSHKKEFSEQNYQHFQESLTQISYILQKDNLQVGILNKRNNSLNLNQFLTQKFTQLQVSTIANILTNVNTDNVLIEEALLKQDLILMLVQGDLTESERELISLIHNRQQKILVIFDDIDFSVEEEKNLIWQKIKNRLEGIIAEEFILRISSQQQKVKLIKYQDTLNYQEWEEIAEAKYEQLLETFTHIIEQEKSQLILLTAYRNALNLEQQIRSVLHQIRKAKSLVIIDKYQLIAASATFANPVSSLDLLATAAINTQMIVDLSKVYQCSLSLNQAQEIAIALGKLMMKLGIVELSSQAVANILKSNALTFVAGGVIQGVSAAYLTRICGLSLVEYYQTSDLDESAGVNLDAIKEKIQLVFQQNKDGGILRQFVQNTALRLKST